jgi:hypothetical protein
MLRFALLLILLTCASMPCRAQGGAVIVRVPDGAQPRCINAGTDKVWLTLRRLITTKKQGWFTKDQSVAVIINAVVKADPQPAKPIAFPLLTEGTFGDAVAGQVSVPLEYNLMAGLNLRQSTITYEGLNVELTLLNRRGKNGWGNALAALGEITKKLPIPASPLTQAASYLMDFANSAVTKDLNGQDVNDKVKSASLALNFDPTGKCGGLAGDGSDFETTGTLAVLTQDGVAGGGYVDLNRTNDYCWAADLRPVFVLKAAHKQVNVPCGDQRYKPNYKQVTNNYVGFFLNAIAGTKVSGAAPAKDRKQSITRCIANDMAEQDCLK